MHLVADQVANESPHFIDLVPGGLPEIVGAREKAYGYYEAGPIHEALVLARHFRDG